MESRREEVENEPFSFNFERKERGFGGLGCGELGFGDYGSGAEFSKEMKSELLTKFKRSEFSQEIDYEKFEKSLNIILTMKSKNG
jgi:hypothetical protein